MTQPFLSLVRRLDNSVDEAFDRWRGNRLADRVFYSASELGNHSIIWHVCNGVQAVRTGNFRRAVLVAATLGVESALVNGPVKMLFRRERPVHESVRPHALRKPKTTSFPSGHATSALCAAALLSDCDRGRRKLYYGLAAVVAVSRVHVRIHHASDVVAGALFGAGFGALATKLLRGR